MSEQATIQDINTGTEVDNAAAKPTKPQHKKRKRKGTLSELRSMVSPTKPFEFPNPDDPNDIYEFTARKLSPGHLLRIKNTAFIKAYQKRQYENAAEEIAPKSAEETIELSKAKENQKKVSELLNKEDTEKNRELLAKANIAVGKAQLAVIDKMSQEEKDKFFVETFTETAENVEFSAEVASLSIVDENHQNYMTPEEVMLYMPPDWHTEISKWALGGASPQDTENPDETDDFPLESDGS